MKRIYVLDVLVVEGGEGVDYRQEDYVKQEKENYSEAKNSIGT